MQIRPWLKNDSYQELTDLVRGAYKRLADLGFNYWGTRQTLEDTMTRVASGECYVMENEGALIGTILLSTSHGQNEPAWYKRPDVATFHQFAVDPGFQKRGIGATLLDFIEARARQKGAGELACDTSEGAIHLIEMYQRRGYRRVGLVDWPGTNYISVILSKKLG